MKNSFLPLLSFLVSVVIVSCNSNKSSAPGEIKNPDIEQKDTSAPAENGDVMNMLYPFPDISPMDMCYFPVDYTKLKMTHAISTPPLARVIYSRPHLQGRQLFNGIIKYGEAWRLGANESTEIDLYSDATIQGKKIKSGRYVLYCIPEPKQWTIIFNTNTDTWGLRPDSTKDIARFTIPVNQIKPKLEYFTMVFSENPKGADLIMAWENTEARLPFEF